MNLSPLDSDFDPTLDTSVFSVETQTTPQDRQSLLSIQAAVRNARDHYVYLEVGSHLGGTLVPHLQDPRCKKVISVDARPPSQLDERGVIFDYVGNSTQRMVETLKGQLPEAALLKLNTIDADISDVTTKQISSKIDLALIDAEHTNVAVFRDFIAVQKFLQSASVVVFHDAHLIYDGLQNIECHLRDKGLDFDAFFLPSCVFVILLGKLDAPVASSLRGLAIERQAFIEGARAALWRTIAANVSLMQGDVIGHR